MFWRLLLWCLLLLLRHARSEDVPKPGSLALIERIAPSHSAAILDVGAGESTLVDDLAHRGYANITALDMSEAALRVTKEGWGQSHCRFNG